MGGDRTDPLPHHFPLDQRGALTAHAVTRTVLLAVEREAMRDLLLPNQPAS